VSLAGNVIDAFIQYGSATQKVQSSSHGKSKLFGAYLLRHVKTGKVYVGSHHDLYLRPYQHKSLLRNHKHFVPEFQAAFNDDPELEVFFIITNTRQQGYEIEQEILDRFHGTGLLFNQAKDARLAQKGLVVNAATRKKLSLAGKGRPHSEEHKRKLKLARVGWRNSPEAIEKMKASAKRRGINPEMTRLAALKNARPVMVEGQRYESIKAVSQAFGLYASTVIKRLNSKNPKFANWFYVK
jgi:hypothetical protein